MMKKILITGGAYQGKYRYAKEYYHITESNCIDFKETENFEFEKTENMPKYTISFIKQKTGIEDVMNEIICFNNMHLLVKQAVKHEIDVIDLWKKILNQFHIHNNWCVIMDEIGNGIVPIDRFEREYREKAGIFGCYIAGEADEVVRVICGIGNRIK